MVIQTPSLLPDQIITREQMAAMIYRYVVSKGMVL